MDIAKGVYEANLSKPAGMRIVAVGIGSLDVNNLQLISGDTADDDYYTTDFSGYWAPNWQK
ncbi:MAG: hypothetical protein AB9888_13330 [Bacteroidales bacterium]